MTSKKQLYARLYKAEQTLWDTGGLEWCTYDRYILMEELEMFKREPHTSQLDKMIALWHKRLYGETS